MIYYTADTHFGYEPIIEQTGRPFSSVEDMGEALMRNWNAVVSEEDTVYLIGDIGGYCTPLPVEYLSRLSGHKHLIRGNHDTGLDDQQRLFDFFESVTDFLEIDDGGFHITLCHYPIVYIQGGYMIHGHLHNTQKETFRILKQLPRVMNAGVDINDFRPVTLDQLIINNQQYYGDPLRGCLYEWQGGDESRKRQKWTADFRPLPIPLNNKEEK